MEIERLPDHLETCAFRKNTEYAWQKDDLAQVYDYCIAESIAILGGEAWVVLRVENMKSDEPTEFIHNLDPVRSENLTLLGRTRSHVIYGTFPFIDGGGGVFAWSNRCRAGDESWTDYVNRTVDETKMVIENGKLENYIVPEYASNVYYNLVFKSERD